MMTYRRMIDVWILAWLASILLSACNMPGYQTPTQPPLIAIYTAAALTQQAQMTQARQPPTLAPSSTQPSGAGTPGAALTPAQDTPAASSTAAPPQGTAAPTVQGACERAKFIADVSVPDNSEFSPGESFVKTWRLKNAGDCAWTSGYSLVFDGENPLGAPAYVPVTTGSVAPGDTVDISVPLKAPEAPGSYRQDFMLINAAAQKFGIGEDNKPFWVKIVVEARGGIAFDLLAQAMTAQWKSGSGKNLDILLAFGGAEDDANGVAKIVDGVPLENGSISSKVLLTYPLHNADGAIAGIYPVYRVENGDHLLARLGFISAADGRCGNGSVTFQVGYQINTTLQVLGEWRKGCDGTLLPVEIDLSPLKGQSIQVIFAVKADGDYQDDWAIWSSPRIER